MSLAASLQQSPDKEVDELVVEMLRTLFKFQVSCGEISCKKPPTLTRKYNAARRLPSPSSEVLFLGAVRVSWLTINSSRRL